MYLRCLHNTRVARMYICLLYQNIANFIYKNHVDVFYSLITLLIEQRKFLFFPKLFNRRRIHL